MRLAVAKIVNAASSWETWRTYLTMLESTATASTFTATCVTYIIRDMESGKSSSEQASLLIAKSVNRSRDHEQFIRTYLFVYLFVYFNKKKIKFFTHKKLVAC
ncbi:hypothetical protein B9Z55_028834 [Caenorhabditis nigoni]|uniref:Uncharacterized protein n=1 Tax=Caenorhabditis nigoni TaxID=1611254 RepID=A0A2G5S9R9_9PELO|nr:hypothetical protein B9Z55_028834 [Caenorhabditis nigoni]